MVNLKGITLNERSHANNCVLCVYMITVGKAKLWEAKQVNGFLGVVVE